MDRISWWRRMRPRSREHLEQQPLTSAHPDSTTADLHLAPVEVDDRGSDLSLSAINPRRERRMTARIRAASSCGSNGLVTYRRRPGRGRVTAGRRSQCTQEDDRNGVMLLQLAQDVVAGHSRHHEIEQQQVRFEVAQVLEGGRAVEGRDDAEPLVLERDCTSRVISGWSSTTRTSGRFSTRSGPAFAASSDESQRDRGDESHERGAESEKVRRQSSAVIGPPPTARPPWVFKPRYSPLQSSGADQSSPRATARCDASRWRGLATSFRGRGRPGASSRTWASTRPRGRQPARRAQANGNARARPARARR